MNTNNAPFRVGQKMVRIGPTRHGFVEHGKVYTCAGCFQCACGMWETMIKELPVSKGPSPKRCDCSYCGADSGYHPYRVGAARYFAPIEPSSVSIPESLKEQAEELVNVKETIAQPEKETV